MNFFTFIKLRLPVQMESFSHLMKAVKNQDTFIACGQEGPPKELQYNPVVRKEKKRPIIRPPTEQQTGTNKSNV